MPTSTATYAKNSVVLNAAFVSVLRRRTLLRRVEMASSLRSVTPPRVGAEVLTCGPPWDGGGRIAGGPSRSARGGRPSRTSGREESQARELAGPARPDRNYPSVSDRQTFDPSGKPPDPPRTRSDHVQQHQQDHGPDHREEDRAETSEPAGEEDEHRTALPGSGRAAIPAIRLRDNRSLPGREKQCVARAVLPAQPGHRRRTSRWSHRVPLRPSRPG